MSDKKIAVDPYMLQNILEKIFDHHKEEVDKDKFEKYPLISWNDINFDDIEGIDDDVRDLSIIILYNEGDVDLLFINDVEDLENLIGVKMMPLGKKRAKENYWVEMAIAQQKEDEEGEKDKKLDRKSKHSNIMRNRLYIASIIIGFSSSIVGWLEAFGILNIFP